MRRSLAAVAVTFAALAFVGSAGAAPSCARSVLEGWRDGRIPLAYPVSCYRQALAQLPEDVRVYSTAEDDITRALHARVRVAVAAHGASVVAELVAALR
jgi:hypothetical protein